MPVDELRIVKGPDPEVEELKKRLDDLERKFQQGLVHVGQPSGGPILPHEQRPACGRQNIAISLSLVRSGRAEVEDMEKWLEQITCQACRKIFKEEIEKRKGNYILGSS